MRACLLLLAALCATATARELRGSSVPANWWQNYPDKHCSVDNYICVDGYHFCLGGYVMRCADGTYCHTQSAADREKISPCITDWPVPAVNQTQNTTCEAGWKWHEVDLCCVPVAEPCGDGFWWSVEEGCCRKVKVTVTEHTCEEGWKWHEVDECCVPVAEPCGEGFWWSKEEGCCRKVIVTEHPEDECEEGWKWHEDDECCVPVAEPCGDGFWWSEEEGCCRKVIVTVTEDDCDGYGCDVPEPAGGWKYAECEGKDGCHPATTDACVLPNWHCVDGLHFCLADKVMRCAEGTVCRTAPFLLYGISPCVWP